MSQDADTTLSGPDERNPNTGPGEWAELASRLHDELVGLLTRKPEAAADLAPAIELAAQLRAQGERHWRWLALHGSALGDLAATAGGAAAESGVLDEFAAIPRPRQIRQADRFIKGDRPAAGGGPRPVRPQDVVLEAPRFIVPGESAEKDVSKWLARQRREALSRQATGGRRKLASFRSLDEDRSAGRSGQMDVWKQQERLIRLIVRADGGLRDSSGRRFTVEGRSLHEHAPDTDRPPISVSHADYERIARVLAALAATGGGGVADAETTSGLGIVQAKAIREGTGDAELTSPLEPRLVSLTHVYICLRCWQTAHLVSRQSGGWFMPVPYGDHSFPDLAGRLWRQLAVGEVADGLEESDPSDETDPS